MFLGEKLASSIAKNLCCIFNSRCGSLPGREDFGLPDLTSFYARFPSSMNDFVLVIKEAIEKFEPRLSGVNVILEDVHQSNNVIVRIKITAEVIKPDKINMIEKNHGCGEFLAFSDFLTNSQNQVKLPVLSTAGICHEQ